MATLAQLFDFFSSVDGVVLRNRVAVAATAKAQSLMAGQSPSANQIAWAREVLKDPNTNAIELTRYVLAANKAASIQQITDATDAAVETNVNTAADAIIAGMA